MANVIMLWSVPIIIMYFYNFYCQFARFSYNSCFPSKQGFCNGRILPTITAFFRYRWNILLLSLLINSELTCVFSF